VTMLARFSVSPGMPPEGRTEVNRPELTMLDVLKMPVVMSGLVEYAYMVPPLVRLPILALEFLEKSTARIEPTVMVMFPLAAPDFTTVVVLGGDACAYGMGTAIETVTMRAKAVAISRTICFGSACIVMILIPST
jgi:hypothetical protein